MIAPRTKAVIAHDLDSSTGAICQQHRISWYAARRNHDLSERCYRLQLDRVHVPADAVIKENPWRIPARD